MCVCVFPVNENFIFYNHTNLGNFSIQYFKNIVLTNTQNQLCTTNYKHYLNDSNEEIITYYIIYR